MIFYFQLPQAFGVVEVVDFFIKMHDIFNLKFDDNLANAMTFIEVMLYKNTAGRKKPTAYMKSIHNQLQL